MSIKKNKLKHTFKLIGLSVIIAAVFWLFVTPSDNYFRDRAVKLHGVNDIGSCSGEQVEAASGQTYILTAAHCLGLADESGSINVETEEGRFIKRKVVAEDIYADLLLLDGLPGVSGLKVADAAPRGAHLRTFTSGRGFKTYETQGSLIAYKFIVVPLKLIGNEKDYNVCLSMPKYSIFPYAYGFNVCALSVDEVAITATIVPGSSGGMVIDDSGSLVGVVSASDGTFGYIVPLPAIRKFLSNY